MSEHLVELRLYEPGFLGYARWELVKVFRLSDDVRAVSILESGSTRRPKGAKYECFTRGAQPQASTAHKGDHQ